MPSVEANNNSATLDVNYIKISVYLPLRPNWLVMNQIYGYLLSKNWFNLR